MDVPTDDLVCALLGCDNWIMGALILASPWDKTLHGRSTFVLYVRLSTGHKTYVGRPLDGINFSSQLSNSCYTDIQQKILLSSIIIEVGIQTTDQGNFGKEAKDENATASKCDLKIEFIELLSSAPVSASPGLRWTLFTTLPHPPGKVRKWQLNSKKQSTFLCWEDLKFRFDRINYPHTDKFSSN